MTSATSLRSASLTLRWRTLEWWGAGIALFLLTGAIFPLLLGQDGNLTEAARAQLRILNLPVYAIAAVLLYRHPGQLALALRRNLPLLLLLLLPVMSVIWSQSPSITVRRLIALVGSALLAYLLAIRFTPRQIIILLGCVLGPLMALSALVIAASPGREFQIGVFMNKNVLGWISAYAVVVGLAIAGDRASGQRMGRQRMGGLAVFGLGLLCTLGSQSSTALMSVVAALLFAGVHSLLRRTKGMARLLLILVLLQAAVLFLSSLHLVIVPTLEALGKDATLTGRVPLWDEVDKAIAARPMLGYGYQAFWTPVSSEAWRIWAAVGWSPPHAHNGYRETLLSLGIVGGAALALLVAQGLRQGARLDAREPEAGWYWLNVLFGMFLVTNLTESLILAQNDFFWTMFMTYAAMFALRSADRGPPHFG